MLEKQDSMTIARQTVTPAELWRQLFSCLADLRRATNEGRFSVEAFQEVMKHLNCLPLTQSDYGLAKQRLENARNCAMVNDCASASYELQLMARGLRQLILRDGPAHLPTPHGSA